MRQPYLAISDELRRRWKDLLARPDGYPLGSLVYCFQENPQTLNVVSGYGRVVGGCKRVESNSKYNPDTDSWEVLEAPISNYVQQIQATGDWIDPDMNLKIKAGDQLWVALNNMRPADSPHIYGVDMAAEDPEEYFT